MTARRGWRSRRATRCSCATAVVRRRSRTARRRRPAGSDHDRRRGGSGVRASSRPGARAGAGSVTGGEWDAYFPGPADLVQTSDGRRPGCTGWSRAEIDGQTDLDAGLAARPAGQVGQLAGLSARRTRGGEPLPACPGRTLAPTWRERSPPVTVRRWPGRMARMTRSSRSGGWGSRATGPRARTGFLYQATHLRPEDNWAFLAERASPPTRRPGRSARCSSVAGGAWPTSATASLTWPQHQAATVGGRWRVLVYLATPALWPGGWRIPSGRRPAGRGGERRAGARRDPNARPRLGRRRALRWAVPAGSVYLLEFDDASGRRGVGAGDGMGRRTGAIEGSGLRTAGFGVVLTGAWT